MEMKCPSCGELIKIKNKKSARCKCGAHVKIIREKDDERTKK